MKIVITGHTRGLGKNLFEAYEKAGHDVVGYSLSRGCDLTDHSKQRHVAKATQDADVFINNAPGLFQHMLFIRSLEGMYNKEGTVIVNVSSLTSRYGVGASLDYSAQKAALDIVTTTHQLKGVRWPAALLFRAGYIDTDRSAAKQEKKVSVEHCTKLIIDAVAAAHSDDYRINEILVVK
jgi:NAD(P)-dependent dehydrogenase (short-subunit alcohol dehydrogenase family)